MAITLIKVAVNSIHIKVFTMAFNWYQKYDTVITPNVSGTYPYIMTGGGLFDLHFCYI